MNQYSHFAIEKSDVIRPQAKVDPDQWKLLRRLRLPDKFNDPQKGAIKRAMVIDVETTGLSTENDDVIQLAMLPFDYEVDSGRILTVHKALAFEGLREPAVLISEEASLITGITDAMVAGKSIDDAAVAAAVADADLVIAHNAYFDRAMVERDTSPPKMSLIPGLPSLDDEDAWGFGPNTTADTATNELRHVGRNDLCPCGSGKKFKKCCLH